MINTISSRTQNEIHGNKVYNGVGKKTDYSSAIVSTTVDKIADQVDQYKQEFLTKIKTSNATTDKKNCCIWLISRLYINNLQLNDLFVWENSKLQLHYTYKDAKTTENKVLDLSELDIDMQKCFQVEYEIFRYKRFGDECTNEEAKMAVKNYVFPTKLVLSGGGAKGIVHVGFLQAICLAKIKQVYGNSAGALVGVCIACGATEKEMCDIIPKLLFNPPKYHFRDSKKDNQKAQIKQILSQYIELTIKKRLQEFSDKNQEENKTIINNYLSRDYTKNPLTFNDLSILKKYIPGIKDLIVNGTAKLENITQEVIFSKDTTPDVSILSAAIASASIPPIFTPELFTAKDLGLTKQFEANPENKVEVIDGGFYHKVLINTAAKSLDNEKTNLIVVCYLEKGSDVESAKNLKKRYKKDLIKSLLEWLFKVRLFFANNSTDYHMLNQGKKNSKRRQYCNTVILNTESEFGVSTTSFEVAKKKQKKLEQYGYDSSIKQMYYQSAKQIKGLSRDDFIKKRLARIGFRNFYNKKNVKHIFVKKNLAKKIKNCLAKENVTILKKWCVQEFGITVNENSTLLQIMIKIAEAYYERSLPVDPEDTVLNTIIDNLIKFENEIHRLVSIKS